MVRELLYFLMTFLRLALSQNELQLPEGSSCKAEEGVTGVCVNMFRCQSVATYYTHRYIGLAWVKKFPEPVVCSYRLDGEPIVCCPDCSLDHSQSLKSKYGVNYEVKRSKAWAKCWEYFRTLPYPCPDYSSEEYYRHYTSLVKDKTNSTCIVMSASASGQGGYRAEMGQFPHMALLGYGAEHTSAVWLCGGAIISERFILTAAHCSSAPKLGPVTFAGLGVLTRSELNDSSKIYKIKSIIRHPEYKPPIKYHDISLLKTEAKIIFRTGLLPACLNDFDHDARSAVATGWGRLGRKGELAEHLMVMRLNAYTEDLCSKMFPRNRLLKNGFDNKTQSCYGRTDKIVDTCEGDSGGPLQNDNCVNFVYGVTSFGRDCGIPDYAGVYTRVSFYVPWIDSVVWPDH